MRRRFGNLRRVRNRAAAPRSHALTDRARRSPERIRRGTSRLGGAYPNHSQCTSCSVISASKRGFEPLVSQLRPDHHVNGKCQRDDPKSGFPDQAGKFPDPSIEFPVTPKKFPVPMRREFFRKSLYLLPYLGSFGGFAKPNGENSLFFPCYQGIWGIQKTSSHMTPSSSGESDELRSERRSRRGRVPTFDRRVRCPYRRSPERTGCERSACRRSAWRQSSRCARNQGTKSGNTVGRLKFQEFSNAVAAGPSHISAARRISALDASDGSSAFRAVSAPQTKHMHRN